LEFPLQFLLELFTGLVEVIKLILGLCEHLRGFIVFGLPVCDR
jgi:hypothetical protein